MKKTVHITSSNITLANRDYHESYEFFKMFGLKSAVLLHFNELPVDLSTQTNEENQNENKTKKEKINNININNNEFSFNPNFYPKEFFHKKLFNNSSNINFSVCRINNDNEITDNKANIIFSTFVNYESLYLKFMEIYPGISNSFFHDCSLIIDEADSILIDELTNGTVLSRSMKTNGIEVLKFIYSCYIENKKVEETFNEVKKNFQNVLILKLMMLIKFPKCVDTECFSDASLKYHNYMTFENKIIYSPSLSKILTK